MGARCPKKPCTAPKIRLPEDEGGLKPRRGRAARGRGPCTGQRCWGKAAHAGCSSWGSHRPTEWLWGPVAARAPSRRLAQLTWASPAAGAGLAGVELVHPEQKSQPRSEDLFLCRSSPSLLKKHWVTLGFEREFHLT